TIGTDWTPGFVTDEHSRVSLVTQHFYALGGCNANKGKASVPRLLAPAAAKTAVGRLHDVTRATGLYGLPVRMGETNSVSCGGQAGVSDVYAASLWGLDYMMLMASNGAAGVNFHTGIGSCSGYAVI